MRKFPKLSPEVMERAVRMIFDAKDQYPSQWAAFESQPLASASTNAGTPSAPASRSSMCTRADRPRNA